MLKWHLDHSRKNKTYKKNSIHEEENRRWKEKQNEPTGAYVINIHPQQLQRFWKVEDTEITESISENAEKSPLNGMSSEFRSLSQA